jgi:DNA-binding Xre family transcriptional regulator
VDKRRRKRIEGIPTVRCNLATLVALKAKQEGVPIPDNTKLSRDAGVALNTVKKYLRDDVQQFDEHVIAAFCKYLNCTVGDLLELDESQGVGKSDG